MKDYLIHFAIGMGGAGAGYYARAFCEHWKHRIAVGTGIVFLETIVTVKVVG